MSEVSSARPKRRIAILGAGPAALAAAWGLTATRELRDRHSVTVYQVGWRAGGKCGTGRRDPGHHIEQNCAHYLFGCYDNTFEMIREVYQELRQAGQPNLPDFDDVLLPRNLVAMKQRFQGEWATWIMEFPDNSARPGAAGGVYLEPMQYAAMSLEWILEMVFGWKFVKKINGLEYQDRKLQEHQLHRASLNPFERLVHKSASGVLRSLLGVSRLLHIDRPWLGKLVSAMLKGTRAFVWWLDKRKVDHDLKRQQKWSLFDYGCTVVIGLLDDRVLEPGGFESIDHLDFKQWLRKHGATRYGYDSPFVTLWYQNSLAYQRGQTDPQHESLSAAIALLAQMRAIYTYKGSVAFSLENEVGDTFIAPVYLALKHRGVKFCFFHRVRDVETDAAGQSVTGLTIERQVSINGGPDKYDPLIEVMQRPCWPDYPLIDQWRSEDRKRYQEAVARDPDGDWNLDSFYTKWKGTNMRLARGDDFDDVLFAMPHSVIRDCANSLYRKRPEWKKLWDENPVAESQSLRLWLKATLPDLGWTVGPPILSGYQTPYCTWEDDSQLTRLQTWQPADLVRSIPCVFGPLLMPQDHPPGPDDPDYLARQNDRANADAKTFLQQYVNGLWPGFDSAVTVHQSVRTNAGPTEGYTMTWPGTLKTRLKADQSGVDGLYLAGDWVRNGLEAGSMEGATMGGLQASRAICGYPGKVLGEEGSYQ